jgi:hypothetical protein
MRHGLDGLLVQSGPARPGPAPTRRLRLDLSAGAVTEPIMLIPATQLRASSHDGPS